MTQSTARDQRQLPKRQAWQSPCLSLLGDVSSLTETGSAPQNESPLNVCRDSVDNVGNTCMG